MNSSSHNLNKPSTRGNNVVLAILLLSCVTFLVFFPTLFNDFTNWDDKTHLLENPTVLSLHPENVIRIFTSIVNKTYIPLTTLSFAIEYHFFRFNPVVYHLDNLLLHLGVVLLVFIFLKEILGSTRSAFIAALIFAIHPMRVESISWVTERKDVLYAFFYMLSAWTYCLYFRRRNLYFFWFSVFCGLLSILAKAMALSLPLILLICDVWLDRQRDRWMVLDKIPFLLVIAPIAWITYSLHVRIPGQSLIDGILIWIWSFAFYWVKFFWPFPVVPLYSLPQPVHILNPVYIQSILIFVLIILLFIRFIKNRTAIFAVSWFFCSIFFLLRYDAIDGSIVADRFMYLPSLGICFGLGVFINYLFDKYREYKIIIACCLALLLCFLGFKTYKQISIWKDSLTLWNYVIAHNGGIDTPYNNRGDVYIRLKKYDLARRDFDKAIAILPDREDEFYNRGVLLSQMNHLDEAVEDFQHALHINPKYLKAWNNLGFVYFQQGKVSQAMECFTRALAVDPSYAQEYYNRGIVYEKLGKMDLAFRDYSLAIKYNPNFTQAYNNRGNLYESMKNLSQAKHDYERALYIDKNFKPAQINLQKLMAKE